MYYTERLLLRDFAPNDQEMVFRGLSHPGVVKYYGVSFDSFEATAEQMRFYAEMVVDGTGRWFAICSPDNRVFYGAAGINSIIKEHKKGELGMWLMPEYWGMGYLQEILPLVLKHGFHKLGLHRIEGLVESDNDKCKKAIEKAGLVYEGTMRDCEIKNGRFISLDIYAALNDSNQ